MAATFAQTNFSLLNSPLPSHKSLSSAFNPLKLNCFPVSRDRRKPPVLAARCCLNLPMVPRSPAGKSLSSVLQNDPQSFYDAVSVELNRVAEDRDSAFARSSLSFGSPEASLHSKTAVMEKKEPVERYCSLVGLLLEQCSTVEVVHKETIASFFSNVMLYLQ